LRRRAGPLRAHRGGRAAPRPHHLRALRQDRRVQQRGAREAPGADRTIPRLRREQASDGALRRLRGVPGGPTERGPGAAWGAAGLDPARKADREPAPYVIEIDFQNRTAASCAPSLHPLAISPSWWRWDGCWGLSPR